MGRAGLTTAIAAVNRDHGPRTCVWASTLISIPTINGA
jgi:hypothetical protein